MNVAVCDDMRQYGEQIKNICWKMTDEWKEKLNVDIFVTAQGLCEFLKRNHVDLLFLDIEIGEISGIDVSRQIRKEWGDEHMQIVYITGTDGYERQLFEFQPMNYIEKPLDERTVKECLKMAYRKCSMGKKLFRYYNYYEERYMEADRIYSFQTEGKNIQMETRDGSIVFRSSLNEIEKRLSDINFVRITQSTIVNLDMVEMYNGNQIRIQNGKQYEISRKYKDKVKMRYINME